MALITNKNDGSKVEMLPCPWCGSTDLYAVNYKRIHCRSCDALGPSPVDTTDYINRNDAIARWNARTALPTELTLAEVGLLKPAATASICWKYKLTGIRLAKPRFGRLSIDEEEDVMQEGRRSYQLFLLTGIWPTNPYMSKKEAMAHEFWGFGLTYAQTEHVGDGFEVLGTPTPVTVIAEQPDGTTIYSIPAQGKACDGSDS